MKRRANRRPPSRGHVLRCRRRLVNSLRPLSLQSLSESGPNGLAFHRVYENPALEQAIAFVDNLIAATGLFFQLRGWRRQRTSRVALAAVGLGIVVAVAVPVSGLLVTCCG
jgi:hypothetical protein